ncbi:MAG: hypothetical protein FWE30_08275 [Bacteroidales bacterium]|nr:hypothetical protein [Bacteroidales bacterium]
MRIKSAMTRHYAHRKGLPHIPHKTLHRRGTPKGRGWLNSHNTSVVDRWSRTVGQGPSVKDRRSKTKKHLASTIQTTIKTLNLSTVITPKNSPPSEKSAQRAGVVKQPQHPPVFANYRGIAVTAI